MSVHVPSIIISCTTLSPSYVLFRSVGCEQHAHTSQGSLSDEGVATAAHISTPTNGHEEAHCAGAPGSGSGGRASLASALLASLPRDVALWEFEYRAELMVSCTSWRAWAMAPS